MTNDHNPIGTDNDKVLARRISTVALITSFVSLGISFASLATIPWNTTISYTRVSNEWRVPLPFIIVPTLFLFVFWSRSRKDQKRGIVPKERIALVVLTMVFVSFFVGGQIYLAAQFAEAA
ncbi:hypothetical protein [Frigoribacterium salinisoli]